MFTVASRVTLLLLVLFATSLMVSSAPAPVKPLDPQLQKRITHTGRGTWFYPGMGNCGVENSVDDPIIAIPESLYDENNGSNCGQWIRITDDASGKTVYGLTEDSCPSCGSGDLDMSPAVFQQMADLGVGELSISWSFMERGWSP